MGIFDKLFGKAINRSKAVPEPLTLIYASKKTIKNLIDNKQEYKVWPLDTVTFNDDAKQDLLKEFQENDLKTNDAEMDAFAAALVLRKDVDYFTNIEDGMLVVTPAEEGKEKTETIFVDRDIAAALTVKECNRQGIEGENFYRSMAHVKLQQPIAIITPEQALENIRIATNNKVTITGFSGTKAPTRTDRVLGIAGITNSKNTIIGNKEHDSKALDKKNKIEPKEYTKDRHLNKIEDIDTKEALEFLLRELETKSSTTQKYLYDNIAVIKNGNKWMHIVTQSASFSIVIYGTFNEDNLNEFQNVSTSARLKSYGITLNIEKHSQIEDLLKLILLLDKLLGKKKRRENKEEEKGKGNLLSLLKDGHLPPEELAKKIRERINPDDLPKIKGVKK